MKSEISLGTKAETLSQFTSILKMSTVPEMYFFKLGEWYQSPQTVLEKCAKLFDKVIVRSSSVSEDSDTTSMAGAFVSIADVDAKDQKSLEAAINAVIKSYQSKNSDNNYKLINEQILVQTFITNVHMSGVVFTQDLNTGAPYYVINYDDVTGKSDTVTSGEGINSNRTLLVHRNSVENLKSPRFINLLHAIQEIEKITKRDKLDIEFIVDHELHVYILQVRPMTTHADWTNQISKSVEDEIKKNEKFFKNLSFKDTGLFGDYTLLGRMPDWNPAEMIGTTPRPLAFSLYDYLITRSSWREARARMGYHEVRGKALMVSLSGQPFIDVRASFNSFLPQKISDQLKEKIVNIWLDRLKSNKFLHDKIEFEVAITCLVFDFDQEYERLMSNQLTHDEKEEFRIALHSLTKELIQGKRASVEEQLALIANLEEHRALLRKKENYDSIEVVSSLLEDGIHFGTIPFSILARHAFIAKSLLNSLVRVQAISEARVLEFQKSIVTIASDFVTDFKKLSSNKSFFDEFLNKYGHLRPGTYDILSPRYDQRNGLFSDLKKDETNSLENHHFEFSDVEIKNISKHLEKVKFDISFESFIQYLKSSISGREYAKFMFTKNLSDALEGIANWGKTLNLNREEISYLTIQTILETGIQSNRQEPELFLKQISTESINYHDLTRAIHLPYLINCLDDMRIIPLLLNNPNFITKKTIKGSCVFLSGRMDVEVDISGKIVAIEGADPGFDWIFSKNITGLITKFGGANSHMAIRCAEFGIPAAIGCGEQIFNMVLKSHSVELCCLDCRINVF